MFRHSVRLRLVDCTITINFIIVTSLISHRHVDTQISTAMLQLTDFVSKKIQHRFFYNAILRQQSNGQQRLLESDRTAG